jgi:hypothetical protein
MLRAKWSASSRYPQSDPQRVFIGIGFAVPIENAAMAVGVPPF